MPRPFHCEEENHGLCPRSQKGYAYAEKKDVKKVIWLSIGINIGIKS